MVEVALLIARNDARAIHLASSRAALSRHIEPVWAVIKERPFREGVRTLDRRGDHWHLLQYWQAGGDVREAC